MYPCIIFHGSLHPREYHSPNPYPNSAQFRRCKQLEKRQWKSSHPGARLRGTGTSLGLNFEGQAIINADILQMWLKQTTKMLLKILDSLCMFMRYHDWFLYKYRCYEWWISTARNSGLLHKFITFLPCWERSSGPNPVDPSQPDLVVHTVGDQLKSCNDQKGGIDTSAKHLWRHVTACNRPWRSRRLSRTLHICISQVQLWKPCILMTSSHILSNCHIQVDWKGIQWIQMTQNQLLRNYRTTDTLLIIKKFHELFLVTFTLPPNCNHLRFFNHSTHPIQYPKSQWTVCFLGNNPGIHGVTADPGRRRRCTKGSAAEKDISSPCRGGRRPFIHPDIISRRLKSVCRDPAGRCFHSSNILTKELE